jgi:hypothetical protein
MRILQRTIRYALTAAQVHTEAGPTKAFAELLLLYMCWFQKSTDEHAWVHLSFWQIRPIWPVLMGILWCFMSVKYADMTSC